ncbi:hypothetical protein [Clostridium sp.]|uniref:hypothetical protein n=1 Tax=Clostridium sp. TaxID=1506 RepID=UPI001A4B3A0E|nr:hypothetical protein [Clostridium sp.]MBK5239781.1 hypothetical protein [Clostridium sp.]
MSIKTTFKEFEIKATLKGDKKATWSENNFNNHMVKVTNTENKTSTSFEYWASISSPKITEKSEILDAFTCFIGDAMSGEYDYKEFCNEFCYEEDSRQARSTWRGCQRANNKLKKIYDKDIYELSDELREVTE